MPTIFWAGDSTVKQNSILTYPQTGIGQVFDRYVVLHQVRIENYAENGRSTKQFIDEGRLATIYDRISEGDFLFIQFGHNDEKEEDPTRYADPETDFPANLEKFINVARNKKAYPVIITPLTRFNRNDKHAKYKHDKWANACKAVGKRLGVAVIDLTTMSEQLVDSMGETARTRYYMNLPKGVYPHFPEGQRDNTHLQPEGALAFAGLIAKGLLELGTPYSNLVTKDYLQAEFEQLHQDKVTSSAHEEIEK